MAQDYHIYLHGIQGQEGNQTKPFSTKKESAFGSKGNDEEEIAETGSSALSKTAPWVAIAIAAAKTTEKVLTIGFSHLREYAGHYEYEMGYNNFKTAFNHVMNPVGYVRQILHRNFQFNKENQRIEQEARLIGSSVYNKTKIGV